MILGKNLSKLIFSEDTHVKEASQEFDAVKISAGLQKIASLDHNPATYNSFKEIMKIASQCIMALDQELRSKNDSISEFEKKAEVRIILDDMIENGLTDEYDVEEKVASLLSKSPSELNVVKEAMSLSGDMSNGGMFDGFEKAASETTNNKGMFESVL